MLQGFKDGAHRVLVATDVAARGIHVDDIAHVVNYDLPQEAGNFIHRVGRTGRAGARGGSWTDMSIIRPLQYRKWDSCHFSAARSQILPLCLSLALVDCQAARLARDSASTFIALP